MLALGLLVAAAALAFYWVPDDADQGFSQRIFYIHVPVALTAYACFGWAAWKALRLLWKGDDRYDLESYTGIHIGIIFGVLTLVTGSIWAKISWGVWWSWGERQLVLFLILFLFYSAYFMLRYSVEPGPRRSRMSAVYAIVGVVLIPVSFLAIRLAENFIHPVVFTRDGPQMAGSMFSRLLPLARRLARSRRGAVPDRAGRQAARREDPRAPEGARVTTAEKYVTAAYLVVLAAVLLYVVIYAFRMSRLERELPRLHGDRDGESGDRAGRDAARANAGGLMGELGLLLFWPALIGYGEAALAYAGDAARPGGRLGNYAVWGVRLGWLAQTALLAVQAAGAEGFPWGSWAGSLNLFVWMCVGIYLLWGCRSPFRLLGLVVMPLVVALLAVAFAAGGLEAAGPGALEDVVLAVHVGTVLAGLAGFTLAAALAAVYLVQDRRLTRHSRGLLLARAPSLATLDRLTGRTIAVALPVFTIGVGLGLVRLEAEGFRVDAVMALALVPWLLYAAFLLLRYEGGWRGRRAAYLALAGFVVVLAVRLVAFSVTHA